MRLSHHLDPAFVIRRLSRTDVDGIVREAAEQAERVGAGEASSVADALLAREREHPTVMGRGLAIPHATVPGVDGPVIGVALAPEPIEFGGEGMDPVQLFFVLLSPPGHERDHVKILARICRLMRQEDILERLMEADDAEGIVGVVTAVDEQHV